MSIPYSRNPERLTVIGYSKTEQRWYQVAARYNESKAALWERGKREARAFHLPLTRLRMVTDARYQELLTAKPPTTPNRKPPNRKPPNRKPATKEKPAVEKKAVTLLTDDELAEERDRGRAVDYRRYKAADNEIKRRARRRDNQEIRLRHARMRAVVPQKDVLARTRPRPKAPKASKAKKDMSDYADMGSRDVWYVRETFAGQQEASKKAHALAKRFRHASVPYAVTTHRNGSGWHANIYLNFPDARQRGLVG